MLCAACAACSACSVDNIYGWVAVLWSFYNAFLGYAYSCYDLRFMCDQCHVRRLFYRWVGV